MLKHFWILLFVLFVLSCTKPELHSNDNLLNGQVLVIGHAGGGFASSTNPFPDNSLASIQYALDGLVADGVELDVQLSLDSTLWIYHDNELNTKTDCVSCISSLNDQQLSECFYLDELSHNSADHPLQKLETIIQQYQGLPYLFFLDIKTANTCTGGSPNLDSYARALEKLLVDSGFRSQIICESSNYSLLQKLRALNTQTRIMLDTSNPLEAIPNALAIQAEGIVASVLRYDKSTVQSVHDAGLLAIIFDVREYTGTLRAMKMHPDGIQTDNIPLLLEFAR